MGDARIWAMRAGRTSEADEVFLVHRQLAIGFGPIGNAARYGASRPTLRDVIAAANPELKPGAVPVWAGQLFRFIHEMKVGDRIAYPRKVDRTIHWGRVTGDYVFDPAYCHDYDHRRAVEWLGVASRDAFPQGALYEIGSTLSLFEVKNFADAFMAVFEPKGYPAGARADIVDSEVDDTAEIVAKDVTETTKDFISKRIKADLKGYPLEGFVADLFRAMGYRAQATRAMRDDGIDVVAHRDELGIEPPIIKIQVKAHDANVGPDLVKSFFAMVHERDVGVFITTGGYTQAARNFAASKPNMRLIDGFELVDLVEKHYAALSQHYRRVIPLRRVWIPDLGDPDGD